MDISYHLGVKQTVSFRLKEYAQLFIVKSVVS